MLALPSGVSSSFVQQQQEENDSQDPPRLILYMILRDEQDIIARALHSVDGLVDYVIICDTGSVDNTVQVVRDTLDGMNLPGRIVHHDWVNFGHNRNMCLAEVRTKFGDNNMVMMMDADEIFETDHDMAEVKAWLLSLVELGKPVSVEITEKRALLAITRVHFITNPSLWHWRDVVHEYLPFPEGNRAEYLPGAALVHQHDGASWKKDKSEKFANYIAMFLQDLERNPNNTRTILGLGDAYYDGDLGLDEAYIYYSQLESMDGPWTELWGARFRKALILVQKGAATNIITDAFTSCIDKDPNRAECMYYFGTYLRSQGMYAECMTMATSAINCDLNQVRRDAVSLMPFTFNEGPMELACTCAHHANPYSPVYQIGLKACDYLVKTLPQGQREAIAAYRVANYIA